MGYHRAGFHVEGVDINPQKNYPFKFYQADALDWLETWADDYDAVHASPPCQAYTSKEATWGRARTHWPDHPDLLGPTRAMLQASGLPYIIENVVGAPLDGALMLCGSMFGLGVSKHRVFETNWDMPILAPATCDHRDLYDPWSGAGRSADKLREAQGIDWLPISGGASRKAGYTGDLFNAIPPAYTEWIGGHLMRHLDASQ